MRHIVVVALVIAIEVLEAVEREQWPLLAWTLIEAK